MKKLAFVASALILSIYSFVVFAPPASAASTNLILNPSFETSSNNQPINWSQGGWGTNTKSFSYSSTNAHTGNMSATVSVSNYISGDAKWYANPVSITPSSSYTYSDYYISNVSTRVVAAFTNASNSTSYVELPAVPASSSWAAYTRDFVAPATATSVVIYHLINQNGSLTIDDVSLSPTTAPTPPPVSGNLVANPSLEISANGTVPTSWRHNSWGSNTPTFAYIKTDGHTGTHSVKVTVSKYVSGDAKWYTTPVAVTASSSYIYSDYYRSSIASDVVAQYNDEYGNYTYKDLVTAVASTDWAAYSITFTVPAGAKEVTIFHLIAGVGSLSLDDVSLVPATGVTPSATNLVPNPSLENTSTSDTSSPLDWYKGQWGNNNTTFMYSNTGHTGGRSVSITMSNYIDGGANWTYGAQAVTPGKVYSFSDYYQSNTTTQVIVAVTLTDGTTQYVWLGNPYTSDGIWTRFFATFTMPAGAVSAVAYQTISSNGYFTADDYNFNLYTPQGFSSPLVTVTFDDGIASQYTNALPIIQKYGIKGTFYAITGDVGVCNPKVSSICYLTQNQLSALSSAGQEIGSHTVTHPDLTTLSATAVNTELYQSQMTLEGWLGRQVTDLAAPYGDVNQPVLATSQKYYTSQRGVEAGYNSIDNYDQQNLLVQNVDTGTTTAQVESYIDYAKATNTWLILVYHDVSIDTSLDSGYDTTPANFDAQMAYLKASGVRVQTISDGLKTVSTQVTQ